MKKKIVLHGAGSSIIISHLDFMAISAANKLWSSSQVK